MKVAVHDSNFNPSKKGEDIFKVEAAMSTTKQPKDCLYTKLRLFLIFGKFLGIIPLQGMFKANSLNQLNFKYASFQTLVCITISPMFLLYSIFGFTGVVKYSKRTAVDLVNYAIIPACFLYCLFIYIYFIRNSEELIGLLKKWSQTKLYFTRDDENFKRYAFLLIVVAFTITTVSLFTYTFTMFSLHKESHQPILQFYYEWEHYRVAKVMAYDATLSLTLFVIDFLRVYIWFYVDMFVALMARALYFKFKVLVEVADEKWKILKRDHNKSSGQEFWNVVAKEHEILCEVLEKFAEFLSPLIFASYCWNLLNCCLRIYFILSDAVWINDTVQVNNPFLTIWGLLQAIFRIGLVSLNASRVNDFAHDIRKLFVNCPDEFYSIKVQRVMQRVTSEFPIGLHGLNCFYITKPFFLTLLSVVFTVQIVFLQQTPAPPLQCIDAVKQ